MTEHPIRRWSAGEKMAGCCVLAAGLAIGLACGGGPARGPVPSALAGYPSSPAFDEVIRYHNEAGTDGERRLLYTTWFLDGRPEGASQWCSVRPDGNCHEYPYVHAMQSIGRRQPWKLPPQTMALLKQALAEMPPSDKPKLENVLVVSFRDEAGAWQTRVYDRTRRPAAVSTIFGLTGAQIMP